MKKVEKISGKALIPFLVFICVYLVSGIVLHLNGVEMAFNNCLHQLQHLLVL